MHTLCNNSVHGRIGPVTFEDMTFGFEPGQRLQHGLTVMEIVRVVKSQCVLRNVNTYEEKFVELEILYEEYLQRRLTPLTESTSPVTVLPYEQSEFTVLSDASPAARQHARSLYAYISELRKLGYICLRKTPLLQMDFERLKKRLRQENPELEDFSLRTVYEWSRRFDKRSGDMRALLPDFASRGGRGAGTRLPSVVNQAIAEVFQELRLNANRKIYTFEVLHSIEAKIRKKIPASEASALVPSWSTVDRLISQNFDAYDICVRNRGKAFANKVFRAHYPRDRAIDPLAVVEFDDKDTRTFLVNQKTGLPIGRAFLTAGVDQHSSLALGLSIGHRHRSTVSALDTYRSVLLPKGPLLQSMGLLASSARFGIPGIALFDNALYFHASDLESAIQLSTNSICAWAKPYRPTEKSVVENFNGETVEHLLQHLPGFGGEKRDRKMLDVGLATAAMDISVFAKCAYQWAFCLHPNMPREDGMTPLQKWQKRADLIRPRLPTNLDQLDAYFGLSHSVAFRPDGVMFLGLRYQCDRLILLRRRIGHNERVIFRYNPSDLDRIYVLDPHCKKYFAVPSLNPEFTKGLTLYQHKLIRKIAREQRKNNPAMDDMLAAKIKLQELVEQAMKSNKRHQRKWAQNIGDVPSMKKTPKTVEESITDIEHQIDRIQSVEIDATDEHWDLPEDF
ncbi:Mu transposase C-terminal domain-containing protein [Pseudoduganella sp.]|uniref:Mu transposase C-terminal domain-containing protein n=1 Tax=Pseudoduganella sp. TaxID=1880898 RepID=UPI0035B39C72